MQQRAEIKTSVRPRETFQSTLRLLQRVWQDNALSVTQVWHWFKTFQNDPERPVKDGKHTGHPRSRRTAPNIAAVQTQLQGERHQTVRNLAKDTGLSKDTAHRILKKDLGFTKVAPKMIMKVLTEQQKRTCLTIARVNLTKIEADPGVLSRIIATDESWVFTFDPRTKQADMEWLAPHEPRPTKARRSRSQKKTLLILFYDSHGLVSHFFTEENVDSDIYIESLRRMREAIRRKRPHLWRNNSFILLQDNASPHTSLDALEYFHNTDMNLWSHPQYSPDLSPCDFWAFPLLKAKLRGHRFQSVDDLKTAIIRTLKAIPLAEYQDCFDKLAVRYRHCIDAAGGYFEGQRRGRNHQQNQAAQQGNQ